jgi:hypothetical protein
MLDILNLVYFNNTVQNYLISLVIFFGLFAIFRIFRLVLISRLRELFSKTKNDFDDLVIEIISDISKFFY